MQHWRVALDQILFLAMEALRDRGHAVGDRYMVGCAGYVKVDGQPLPDQQVILAA